ncbi:MAG: hypothetical protein LBT14_08860 [Treponema sp.]|jgi:hypothetical protein|nr:hypothetical protein [Treponema sp.]
MPFNKGHPRLPRVSAALPAQIKVLMHLRLGMLKIKVLAVFLPIIMERFLIAFQGKQIITPCAIIPNTSGIAVITAIA